MTVVNRLSRTLPCLHQFSGKAPRVMNVKAISRQSSVVTVSGTAGWLQLSQCVEQRSVVLRTVELERPHVGVEQHLFLIVVLVITFLVSEIAPQHLRPN